MGHTACTFIDIAEVNCAVNIRRKLAVALFVGGRCYLFVQVHTARAKRTCKVSVTILCLHDTTGLTTVLNEQPLFVNWLSNRVVQLAVSCKRGLIKTAKAVIYAHVNY